MKARAGGKEGEGMNSVHVFIYDDRLDTADVVQHRVRPDTVQGTLFKVEGVGAALLLSGHDQVRGEVCRIGSGATEAAAALEILDARARVRDGLFRRVGVQIGATPCWTWVAGPALAPRLVPERRVRRNQENGA